jgi:hypothetical protein
MARSDCLRRKGLAQAKLSLPWYFFALLVDK